MNAFPPKETCWNGVSSESLHDFTGPFWKNQVPTSKKNMSFRIHQLPFSKRHRQSSNEWPKNATGNPVVSSTWRFWLIRTFRLGRRANLPFQWLQFQDLWLRMHSSRNMPKPIDRFVWTRFIYHHVCRWHATLFCVDKWIYIYIYN